MLTEKVGIILINYQDYAAKYLAACFSSLERQTYQNFQVYIIDNASSVESLTYLKTNYPRAKVLSRNDGNYTAANNLGIKAALAGNCPYVVLANMDTEFSTVWLDELVRGAQSDAKVGLVQAKIYLYPKNEAEWKNPKINSLGNIVNFLGFAYTDSYGRSDAEAAAYLNSATYPEIKGYASGCSLLVKAEVLSKIKGYNEEYYMYHDDLELSLKARLAGYRIVLAPRATMYHKYEFKRSVKMIYYMERNRRLFLLSFYPLNLIILLIPPILVMDLGMLFYSLFQGWFKEELKIYAYFLRPRSWRLIRRSRQELKKLSVWPFSRLAQDFSGRIDFQEINNPLLKYFVNPLFSAYWNFVRRLI